MGQRAKEKTLALLGSAAIDLTQATDTEITIFTHTNGLTKSIPVVVVLRDFDEAVDEAVVTLGKTGGTCDEFLGNQTLTNISAGFADEVLILQPVPAATPVTSVIIDDGESFALEITTPETTGTAACVADVFGYEVPI
jgi:hypothetical protein